MAERLVGTVNHFWDRLGVAGVDLSDELAVGDNIRVIGDTTDYSQTVDSIQIDHEGVASAGAGDSIGLKVAQRARVHDQIFVTTPD